VLVKRRCLEEGGSLKVKRELGLQRSEGREEFPNHLPIVGSVPSPDFLLDFFKASTSFSAH
jgi:hypothetical protein